MFFIKSVRMSFLFVLSVLLSACGDGTSSSSSQPNVGQVPFSLDTTLDGAGSKYQGSKKAAKLNSENYIFFLESLYGSTSKISSVSKNITSISQLRSKQKNNTTLNRAISDQRNGRVSGSYHLSGNINEQGQGVVTYEWKNFSDVEGDILDGKSVLNVLEYDVQRDLILKSTTKLIELSSTEKNKTIISNGYLVEEIDLATGKVTTIADMVFYNENSKLWKAFDKLKSVRFSGAPIKEEITGRLYRQDLGYVDISTIVPLVQCSGCEPQHPDQGVLRLTDGDNNSATLTFNNQLKFNLAFKDSSQVETTKAIDWREMNSWIHLNNPPSEPYVLFKTGTPTTNTDAVIEVFSSTDADVDGDEVSLFVTWKVNGEVIEGNNTVTLPHSHYQVLDQIEVSAVNIDSYGGRSSARVITRIVPNTAPSIVVGNTTFTVGETMTLDASGSSDVDGQSLVFSWKLTNTHLPENLITIADPDKAKTQVSVPASGIYHFTVQVKEKNALGEIIEGAYYAEDVFLTVLAEDIYQVTETLTDSVGDSGALRVADVTGDGNEDVIISRFGTLKIKNFANNTLDTVYLGNSSYRAHTILIADMNNDGLNDFILDRDKGFIVSKQEENGNYNAFPSHHLSQTAFNNTVNKIQTGHFNNDNLLDVALLFNTSVEIFLQKEPSTEPPPEDEIVLPPEDNTVFENPVVYKFSNNTSLSPFLSTQMRVADVTGDNLDDIVLITPLENNNYSNLVLMKQKSSGGLEEKIIIHSEIHYTEGDALALLDVNGDQKIDIMATHGLRENGGPSGILDIFYQSSTDNFDQHEKKVTEAGSHQILVSDINKDGKPDVIINNGDKYTIHKQKAEGGISPFWSVYDVVNSTNRFDIGDINADGKLDVVSENGGQIHVRYGM